VALGTEGSKFDFHQVEDIILHSVLVKVKVKVKVKVQFTPEQATKAQRGSRGVAQLFL
jgi:hypothetical protein